jgi:hypothetical protein
MTAASGIKPIILPTTVVGHFVVYPYISVWLALTPGNRAQQTRNKPARVEEKRKESGVP